MARIDPDIQEYFDFKYVEGELHIYIRQELVKALGWTDKDLDMSFGGIKRMNSFKGAHLSIHPVDKDHYQHPWYDQESVEDLYRGTYQCIIRVVNIIRMPLFLIVLGASAIGASIALLILRMNPDYVPASKPTRRGRQRDMDAL